MIFWPGWSHLEFKKKVFKEIVFKMSCVYLNRIVINRNWCLFPRPWFYEVTSFRKNSANSVIREQHHSSQYNQVEFHLTTISWISWVLTILFLFPESSSVDLTTCSPVSSSRYKYYDSGCSCSGFFKNGMQNVRNTRKLIFGQQFPFLKWREKSNGNGGQKHPIK